MACYGPVPTKYHETDFAEEVVDSNAVDSVDMAEETVEGSAEANEEI
ncbi:MAG: hypothetical protein IJQ76_06725 [Prevotella sp.]|nr:hypothetical protein [Prevotella sp.]